MGLVSKLELVMNYILKKKTSGKLYYIKYYVCFLSVYVTPSETVNCVLICF